MIHGSGSILLSRLTYMTWCVICLGCVKLQWKMKPPKMFLSCFWALLSVSVRQVAAPPKNTYCTNMQTKKECSFSPSTNYLCVLVDRKCKYIQTTAKTKAEVCSEIMASSKDVVIKPLNMRVSLTKYNVPTHQWFGVTWVVCWLPQNRRPTFVKYFKEREMVLF